jgi:hypothetical protein
MAPKVSSLPKPPALGEEWIVRVLQGIRIGPVPEQVVVRLDKRRVCLCVVAADGSDEAWSRYSAAAARRAAATGDRLTPLLASGRTDDCFYVAYDLGDAEPLSAHEELAELSGPHCVQLLHGIGRGLDQAATHGLYASELTPESVFVDPDRGAVLADLGVAREALGNPPPTVDRNAAWVAPEVLAGKEAVERSAVYSFGALIYTLLTGAPPHEGSPDEIIVANVPSIRERRPDLPEALDVVIATAMAADVRRRYRTASETRSLANILLQGDLVPGSASRPPTPKPKPKAKPRSKPKAAPARAPKTERSPAQAAALKRQSPEAVAAPKPSARPAPAKTPAGGEAARQGKENGRRDTAVASRRDTAVAGRPHPASRLAGGSRALALALLAGAVAAGALAGVLIAGPGADEPPAPKDFSRSGLEVRLPGDWKGTAPAPGALAAHPAGDPGSGLTLQPVDAPVERDEQGNPVRLGRLEAWREPEVDVAGARAAVRYVIPTESGKVVATCRASPRAAAGTLAACERVASTLQLRSATGLPIAAVVEQQERWSSQVERLATERAGARSSLARAARPSGQRQAAEALERVHTRAAARFGALPGGGEVEKAARRTADSYRALARAANGESERSFNAARARVRRSEAALRQALAEQ